MAYKSREKAIEYQKDWRSKNKNSAMYRAKEMLRSIKHRSKKLGLEYDIDEEWLKGKLKGVCEATGLPFNFNDVKKGYTRNPNTPSIDRIDSSRGYTKDNCRVVIWMFNGAKLEYDDGCFYAMAKAFVNEYERKLGL